MLKPKSCSRHGNRLKIRWADGTSTEVSRHADDQENLYLAFCAALAKRVYGSSAKVSKYVDKIDTELKVKEAIKNSYIRHAQSK